MTPSANGGGSDRPMPNGVLAVHKPGGITSHDVVGIVRRLFGTRRVGHAGTLDPLATGVLAVCVGPATRIAEYLAASTKEYIAGVEFGVQTDTQDATGRIVAEDDASSLTPAAVEEALRSFRGTIRQVPPMVSAVHHEGRRLYALAREGLTVERAPREVTISTVVLEEFVAGARATARLRVGCSAGTYIRALAADLGCALGVGGAMASLVRTRSGSIRLEACRTLEHLVAMREAGRLAEALVPIASALAGWPRAELDEAATEDVLHGRPVRVREGTGLGSGMPVLALLVDVRGDAVAIARVADAVAAPLKVLVRAT